MRRRRVVLESSSSCGAGSGTRRVEGNLGCGGRRLGREGLCALAEETDILDRLADGPRKLADDLTLEPAREPTTLAISGDGDLKRRQLLLLLVGLPVAGRRQRGGERKAVCRREGVVGQGRVVRDVERETISRAVGPKSVQIGCLSPG
jgi:hypothetical protein